MAERLWRLLLETVAALWGGNALAVIAPGDRRPVSLRDFDPAWLPDPPQPFGPQKWGINLLCPLHGNHRLELYFEEPLDGGLPAAKATLYRVENAGMEEPWDVISVHAPDEKDPIHGHCGASFYLLGGAVILSAR